MNESADKTGNNFADLLNADFGTSDPALANIAAGVDPFLNKIKTDRTGLLDKTVTPPDFANMKDFENKPYAALMAKQAWEKEREAKLQSGYQIESALTTIPKAFASGMKSLDLQYPTSQRQTAQAYNQAGQTLGQQNISRGLTNTSWGRASEASLGGARQGAMNDLEMQFLQGKANIYTGLANALTSAMTGINIQGPDPMAAYNMMRQSGSAGAPPAKQKWYDKVLNSPITSALMMWALPPAGAALGAYQGYNAYRGGGYNSQVDQRNQAAGYNYGGYV